MNQAKKNPRHSNGARRRRVAARQRAKGLPCWLCGRPIDYGLPPGHPGSFEVDEFLPVSRWREFGYEDPAAPAIDEKNLRSAHRLCNQRRGNRMPWEKGFPFARPRPASPGGEAKHSRDW